MKIRGKSGLKRPSDVIKLDCGEKVTVLAPPLGVPARAMKAVPPPAPPKRLVRQKGELPQYLADETDPAFRAADAYADQLRLVYIAWEAIKDVPPADGIDLDTRLADGEAPTRQFVERLAAELKSSALTQGDLMRIGEFVARTSGATKEEAENAQAFFGSPELDVDG